MKSTTSMLASFIAIALLPQLASAHGKVTDVSVNGKSVGETGIRLVENSDPLYGVDNDDINCGRDAKPAKGSVSVNPGDELELVWSDGKWPHNIGHVITYLARCDGPCSEFDSKDAKFFKISQLGKKDDLLTWFQDDIKNGKPANVELPKNLAAGEYLCRHEIIALHIADQKGPEFYPNCIQMKVGGKETGVPDPKSLVSFPGGYKEDDPGLSPKGVFDAVPYPFPGPPIANLSSTGGSGPSQGEETEEPTASSTRKSPKPTGGAASSASKSDTPCQVKKREEPVVRPRALSRIMYHLRSSH